MSSQPITDDFEQKFDAALIMQTELIRDSHQDGKSVRPKSRTDILRVRSMHKHLIDRHKQWIMKDGTQCVQETLS